MLVISSVRIMHWTRRYIYIITVSKIKLRKKYLNTENQIAGYIYKIRRTPGERICDKYFFYR